MSRRISLRTSNSSSNLQQHSFLKTQNADIMLNSYSSSSNDILSTPNINCSHQLDANSFITQIDTNQLELMHDQLDIKEELIEDFNILELLQDDPDMLRLLESVNCDAHNYLPQISVNSASRILDNVDLTSQTTSGSSEVTSTTSGVIHESSSFKNLCDLLSLNNSNSSGSSSAMFGFRDDEDNYYNNSNGNINGGKRIKVLPPTPPLSPPVTVPIQQPSQTMLQLTPTRVSMRLIKKKTSSTSSMAALTSSCNERSSSAKMTRGAARSDLKRKRSYEDVDDENEDEDESQYNSSRRRQRVVQSSTANSSSNENSVDYNHIDGRHESSGDYIYFDDDEEEDDDNMSTGGGGGLCMRRSRMSTDSRADSVGGDPMKKESNKEAATRYRLKKLSEKDRLFETRVMLEKDNELVKKRIELAQTEINYLKNLLVQMLLTKGALNSSNFTNFAASC